MRRPAAVLIGLITTGLLGLSPAQGVEGAETQRSDRVAVRPTTTLRAPVSVVAGEQITLQGTQRAGRVSVRVQRQAGKRWVAVGRLARARKKFTLRTTVPLSVSGRVRFRAQVKVRRSWRTVARTSSRVDVQRLTLTSPRSSPAAAATTFTATLTPARAGRVVVLEEYLDNRWREIGRTTTHTSTVRLPATTAGYPTHYQLRALPLRGLPGTATASVRTTLSRVPTAIAHRASAALAPEQTFAALEATLATGAPAMEVDVQLTKDKVPVLVHDETWLRTTDIETVFADKVAAGEVAIADLTLAEVRQLDASSWFPGYTGTVQRVPTLAEWLDRLDQRATLVLEIKDPEVVGNTDVLAALGELMGPGQPLRDLADAGKLSVSSFGVERTGPNPQGLAALQYFHDLDAGIPLGFLTPFLVPSAVPAFVTEVHPMIAFSSRADVQSVQRGGRTVSVWTADSLASHRAAVATGADRVITDDPRLLKAALNPVPPPSA